MSNFDIIHNVITEQALAMGKTTVIKCTPTELTRAIMNALTNQNWRCTCTVQGGSPYQSGCPIHDHTVDTSNPHWRKMYDDHLEAQREVMRRLGWTHT